MLLPIFRAWPCVGCVTWRWMVGKCSCANDGTISIGARNMEEYLETWPIAFEQQSSSACCNFLNSCNSIAWCCPSPDTSCGHFPLTFHLYQLGSPWKGRSEFASPWGRTGDRLLAQIQRRKVYQLLLDPQQIKTSWKIEVLLAPGFSAQQIGLRKPSKVPPGAAVNLCRFPLNESGVKSAHLEDDR